MGSPNYVDAVTEEASDDDGGDGMGEAGGRRSGESDPLYDKAVEVVLTEKARLDLLRAALPRRGLQPRREPP